MKRYILAEEHVPTSGFFTLSAFFAWSGLGFYACLMLGLSFEDGTWMNHIMMILGFAALFISCFLTPLLFLIWSSVGRSFKPGLVRIVVMLIVTFILTPVTQPLFWYLFICRHWQCARSYRKMADI